VATQSSDKEFHCLTSTLFYRTRTKDRRKLPRLACAAGRGSSPFITDASTT
jgi:hypothetical protein